MSDVVCYCDYCGELSTLSAPPNNSDSCPHGDCRRMGTLHLMPKPMEDNNSHDISTELRRTYTWADGSTVTIESPVLLITSENGHRIADVNNNGHYVPHGWIHLYWENKQGAPAIVA